MKNKLRDVQKSRPQKPRQPASLETALKFNAALIQWSQPFLKQASDDQVKKLLGRAEKLCARDVRRVFRQHSGTSDDFADLKAKWSAFYQKHFNLALDFANIVIPPKPAEGNWRLIIVASGLTMNQVYEACAKQFTCYRYADDLDKNIKDEINGKATRPSDTSYAVWVEANEEAPAKYANKSADDLQAENHNGITVKERLLLELVYFEENGQHLDAQNITRCDGSRYSGGSVHVLWHDGKMWVDYFPPDYRFGHLRSRSVSF